ncbi:SDR family oxidoreductase [Vibrio ulleungensis]|uniref:Divinyl chlorophyllide a 8-vinyl-reductase, chloroplastic n=1 Tax=Vibrio ulleungensis TaxID=2807619 RepID=A0ABS2HH44_9VIBR|nr:SDR family oxidoreductase [Vibrio ulleungensis]MBM7035399.1 SDR family oxidoreductase [Vibrio ulleungensis]
MDLVKKMLIVGATGYLGLHIIKQLQQNNQNFVAVARNRSKLIAYGVLPSQIIEAEVTDPQQLMGICEGVDTVISCLGITRQKDGLSYMDVDYQANLNVLLEAEPAGVRRFLYISAFNAEHHPKVRLLCAKESFAKRLLASTQVSPCVIRPNGFFVDLEEYFHMATKGKIYQFGQGKMKMNPIDGEDLAQFCLSQIESDEHQCDIGGPQVLTVNEIAELAFKTQNKAPTITSIPDVVRRGSIALMGKLPEKWGGPAEFFLTMLGQDSVAPHFGKHTIEQHFKRCYEVSSKK